ncbi:MAG: metallophosphoesterase family protein, partial [Povalibacter sp.]
LSFLQGSSQIIHAGDIGAREILDALGKIAPVTAVRGNNDTQSWAEDIPMTQSVVLGGVRIFVIHDIKTLRDYPAPRDTRVIVAGHSHKPLAEERDGVLFVNPGSAGRRRFSLPIAVGELVISAGAKVTSHIRELKVS